MAQQVRHHVEELGKGPAREPTGCNVPQRLGRVGIAALDGKTKKIARQRKPDDLPASVGRCFVEADDSFGDDMDRLCWFTLIDESRLVFMTNGVTEAAEPREVGALQCAADAELLNRAITAEAFAHLIHGTENGSREGHRHFLLPHCRMIDFMRTDDTRHRNPLV
jgi:hypothetical protein